MSEIVERLRWRATNTSTPEASTPKLCAEAAAEITRLEARVAELEKALKPFAEAAHRYDPDEGDDYMDAWDWSATFGQLRKARAALNPSQEPVA